jgi:hypothetical protein
MCCSKHVSVEINGVPIHRSGCSVLIPKTFNMFVEASMTRYLKTLSYCEILLGYGVNYEKVVVQMFRTRIVLREGTGPVGPQVNAVCLPFLFQSVCKHVSTQIIGDGRCGSLS